MVSLESNTNSPGSEPKTRYEYSAKAMISLACSVFGEIGVGVDHLGRGVVLGEEGEHGPGALAAGRHVVLFEGDLAAVVADGVEVQVEPGLTVGEPQLAGLAGEGFSRGDVGGALHPIGVAGEVGGLGQGDEAEQEAEAWVAAEREGVGGAASPGALEQQQRPERVERGQDLGARVAGRSDQGVETKLTIVGRSRYSPAWSQPNPGARRPLSRAPGL